MSSRVSQDVLDALTDVKIPRPMPQPKASGTFTAGGAILPVYTAGAVVLGSGAAGLRAAVELARRGIDVLVATRLLSGGTSACSGSDKQTYYSASSSAHGDDFLEMAETLSAGGAMDKDTAYVEAVGSVQAIAGLQYLGLPLPQDRLGGILRYQTDHDEAGRATSCGPRTSRLMVRVLAAEAIRLSIPVLGGVAAVSILKDEGRVAGLLAIGRRHRSPDNAFGFCVISSPHLVLAAGGPGELFRDSVYPHGCFGSLGLALDAGLDTVNLTEHQFGIGTSRKNFPWNLSGTYMQSIPRISSRDPDGCERDFLGEYYRTTRELASNVFRKGYQWPFHADRMRDYGSSLVDLAIFREIQAGRAVSLDFSRNPEAVPGDEPFSLDRLDDDARAYLANNDALLDTPIARLERMNPLAIELYRRGGSDLTREPLEFAVNHQHMNGGVAIDIWGRTSLPGCYAAGEAAGTHGVSRPGGSALNAGQVFALRSAQHIHAHPSGASEGVPSPILPPQAQAEVLARIAQISGWTRGDGPTPERLEAEIQARMSDRAGFVCHVDEIGEAVREAALLNHRIRDTGVAIADPGRAEKAVLWRQMALASEAVLRALDFYVRHGGGSRGARVLCSSAGTVVPHTRLGPLEAFRFAPGGKNPDAEQIHVRLAGGAFAIESRPVRALGCVDTPYFEKLWGAFLNGEIYR